MSSDSEEEIEPSLEPEEIVQPPLPAPSALNSSVPTQNFKETFTCVPLVHDKKYERGGKLLLPSWVLDELYYSNVPLPYTFKVTNKTNLRSSHAGVLEFTVEKADQVKTPSWFMKFLDLKKGDKVEIESVFLPSATYCKIEPLTRNCAYISNFKNVLEQNLKYFACITEGDILCIHEINANQLYKMRIVETKPETAVTVFECDIEVEFDVPSKGNNHKTSTSIKIDMTQQKEQTVFKPFQGQGKQLNCEETESHSSAVSNKQFSIAVGGEGSSHTGKKRKTTTTVEDEPPNKKSRQEENDATANELEVKVENRRRHAQKQIKGSFEPFSGKGYSLKDD